MKENEKFLDSIQGKTNRLASSFQMLANNTIESGAIKGLIDFANALVQVIDKIGPLQTALLAITGFTTLFSNGKLATTVASLGKSFLNMGKTFLMLPKTIKQSNENFIGPMQAGTQAISKFRLAAFGAVAAVTLIKGAFDEYTRSLEEQKRKSEELLSAWESKRETLASNKATVEELKSEFADLSNGVGSFGNNVSLTSDEFSRYHQIANQIADMFPEMVIGYDDQGNAILNVKGNVEQLTKAYEAQEAAARRAIMGNAHVVYGQQRRTFTSSSDIFGIEQTGLAERIEVSKRLLEEVDSMQSGPTTKGSIELGALLDGSAFRSGANAYADVVEELNLALTQTNDSADSASFFMARDDIKGNRSALETGIRIYTAEMKAAARDVVPIMEAYLFNDRKFAQLGEDAQDMLIGVISSLDPEYIFKHSDARDLMDSIFGQIVNPVTSSPEGQKNIMSAFTDVDAFRAGKKTVEEYAQSLNDLRVALANTGVDQELAIKFVDMAEIDNVDALIENVKLKLQDEFDDNVGELTLNQLRLAADIKVDVPDSSVIEAANKAQEDFLKKWDKANSSNLRYKNRPKVAVTSENMSVVRGWGMDDAQYGDTMTVASQTYDDGNGRFIVVTPILPDGTLLSQDTLLKYVDEILGGGVSDESKNILLADFVGKDAAQNADEFAIGLHDVHGEILQASADAEDAKLSWTELQEAISNAGAVMSSLTIGERIAAIASAASVANTAFSEQGYSAAVTKEQYDELAKAGEEYVSVIDNTNGYLSINKQKLDALIASKRQEEKANIAIAKAAKLQEFEKNAEAMRMNTLQLDTLTGMTDEYKQSIIDKNAALLSSQEAILAEVNSLDLQASALEYATSAYKRWKDARNAPEAGDMYDDISNAWKDIEEGLKTGKVGTEKYLSAAALLLPEDVTKDDAKAINKYRKSVNKYFAEDGEGLGNFLSQTAKLGFLDQLSDGRYVSNAKTNVESIASALHLTTDSVEAMFLALKDYGGTIELNDQSYKTTEWAKELAKATNDVTDAQEALNKARSGGASKEEISKRESELKAAQDEAQRIASQSPVEVPVELTLEEQYAKKIADLQTLLDNAEKLKIPAELIPDIKAEIARLQTLLDAEPPVGAKVEAEASGVEEAKADIEAGAGSGAEYDASIGVTANQDNLITAGSDIDAVAEKERNAVITVDTQELSDAEKWLAEFQSKMDKLDPEGKEQSLAGSHSGTGYQSTPEEIRDMWASQETPKSPSRVDPDQDVVHLLDTLNEAEKKANEVRETLKNATALALKDELPKFETIDQQAEYLQKKIANLEKVRENLKVVGFDLTPAEEGKLDAYKAALAEISTPITTPVSLETSGALESANNLEKAIESKNPTMTVDVKYSDASGGNFVPKVDMKYAKGTQKAKKGVALTGELGVETVITKDGFYTVGHDGPELVNLRGGEEILNDKDTKKLFNGAEKRTKGQAFGLGTGGFLSNLVNSVKAIVKKVANVVKANKPATTTVGVDTRDPNESGSNKGGGSSAPAPVEEVKEEIKTDFEDWIPRLLDNVRKETDKILANAEKQISYQSQNSEIEKALANNTKLMNLNAQATNRYLQQASQVGLSADLIAKVQNGSIDIALYDENTRKLIADYQKWYDLAQKTKDTITSLQEEQRKLAMSKLDNVQGYYENRIGVYGNRLDIANSTIELGQSTGREIKREDYAPMIRDVNAQLALLRQEKAEYERTFTELVASGVIKEGSNDWYQYAAKVDDMQKSILQASLSLDEFNDLADAIAVNNINVAIKYLNTVQGTLESAQGLRQAQGKELTAVDYEHLISVGMQQVSVLEAQNLELLKQQEGLDVLSSAYQEIQDQIDGNLNGIWNIKISQEGWNDAIADLSINAIKKTNDEYNRQLETMRAIEELEKAKQRRNLVYREGKGFVYEADQGALRDAQRTVDQINIDNLIASLEESKANDNVYDNTGNLLGKLFTGLDGVDFSGYLQSVGSGNETSALLANAIKSIDWNSIKTASGASTSVEFSGGINLYGVDNVQDLAKAINNRLGGYVTQGLYNND